MWTSRVTFHLLGSFLEWKSGCNRMLQVVASQNFDRNAMIRLHQYYESN